MSGLLINRDVISKVLMHDAAWSNSHGAYDDFLGMGMMYYALAYIKKVEIAVCLGSGGGFVPRLMRQAQRDLGIAESSKTILVDANRPKAGWSAPLWLNEDSFFRRNFQDVEIILKTTKEAAESYFKAHRIMIDFLHIDADHSFDACLEDFQNYRPFLKQGSLVTLHDTSFAGAGVKSVVEYLRTRSDCEIINFHDIGAGTAIVCITHDFNNPAAEYRKRPCGVDTDAVTITYKPDMIFQEPPVRSWKYLESAAFSTRSMIAANFVGVFPQVIEIGGARTPIHRYLTGKHESVIVVDPFILEGRKDTLNGSPCRILHVRAAFQDVEWRIHYPYNYGLVILGMDLQGLSREDYEALYRLIEHAGITVIEFPPSWGPSCQQFELIKTNANVRTRFMCKLDLSGNDVGSLENSWLPRFDREVHVLEPAGL